MDFSNIVEMVEISEQDVKVWGVLGYGNVPDSILGRKLTKMKTTLDDSNPKGIKVYINTAFNGSSMPMFVSSMEKLISPETYENKELAVGQASKIVHHLSEYENMIIDWKSMAIDYKTYLYWCAQLKKAQINLEKHKEMLDRAMIKLGEISCELWCAKDMKELKKYRIEKELGSVYKILAYLGGVTNICRPPWENVKEWVPVEDKKGWDPELSIYFKNWVKKLSPNQQDLEENIRKATNIDFSDEISIAAQWFGDFFVITLGIVIAILTGLATLYIDKVFGSFIDYLTAILIGISTPTVMKFLTDTITKFSTPIKSS